MQALMIQLMILSGTLGCPLAGTVLADAAPAGQQPSARDSAHDADAHSDVPTGSHGVHHPDGSATAPSGEHGGSGSHSHCDSPCAPAACAASMHCSASPASVTEASLDGGTGRGNGVLPATLDTPASVSAALDTPPPRA
jgi:hypothetical protein